MKENIMCIICKRLKEIEKGTFAPFVHEFETSYLVIGEHQYFEGYCVLHHKECIADITDLDEWRQQKFFKELMIAAKAVKTHFKAKRINYSCLGNVVSHLHFHIFPRYSDELSSKQKLDPWADADKFEEFSLSDQEYRSLAAELKTCL